MKPTVKLLVLTLTLTVTALTAAAQTTARDFYEKGKSEDKKGDFTAAREDFKKAYDLDPQSLPPDLAEVLVKMKAKDAPGAFQALNTAIKAHPDDAYFYFIRAVIGYAPGGADVGTTTPMADLAKVIELVPGSPDPFIIRSALLLVSGDLDGCIADSTKAIGLGATLDPQGLSLAFENRGKAFMGKKDYDRAAADFSRAVEIDPKNAQYYLDRAGARLSKDDQKGTIEDYSKAIEIDPTNFQTYLNRGLIRNSTQDYTGGISDLTKAIEIGPKNPQVPFAYFNRGISKIAKENYAGAIADFTAALGLDPKYADAYEGRGVVRGLTNDADGSIADLTRSIELDPDNPGHYQHRAEQYRSMNKIDLAIADEKRAAALKKK